MGRSTAWSSGEVLTSSDMNLMPRGKLGYAEVTANQTGITAETDLSGLSVTVTPGTSRRIRVSGFVQANSDTADDEVALTIKEGATELQIALDTISVATRQSTLYAAVILTPTSASHTYKLRLERSVGSGSATMFASATRPCWILVEDIGA